MRAWNAPTTLSGMPFAALSTIFESCSTIPGAAVAGMAVTFAPVSGMTSRGNLGVPSSGLNSTNSVCSGCMTGTSRSLLAAGANEKHSPLVTVATMLRSEPSR